MDHTILHIHVYLYNEILINIARENIKKLKDYGFKILVTSGLGLPSDFYEICDYIFIDHENPLFTKKYKPNKSVFFFYETNDVKLEYHRYYVQFHCLAVLRSIVKGCKLINALGFKNVIRLNYDCSLGTKSFESLKYYSELLQSSYHNMIVYENIREIIEDSDLSLQVVFYKCSSIIDLFNELDTEETYLSQTKKMGYGETILDLERFMYNVIKSSDENILYLKGDLFFQDYSDTNFNSVLCTDTSGFLFDVNYVYEKDTYIKNKIAITCYNQHSSNLNSIQYELYDEHWNLILLNNLSCSYHNEFAWEIYDYVDLKIKYIKITDINYNEIKFYELSFTNDLVIFSKNEQYHSKLIIK